MTGRFLFWLLLAWPTPALIASALGWKGIWGNSNVMADYLVPIPVAGGVFHAMTFIGISVLLVTQPRWPGLLRGAAHAVLFGISVVGAYLIFDLERRQLVANPVGLFLLTDSLIAQLFVGAFGGRGPEGAKEWGASVLAALLVPALAGAALHRLDPRTGQQFVYITSKPGPARGDDAHFVHSKLKVYGPEFKPAAEAYAQTWHPRYNINTEDIAVHFFASLPAAQIGNEHEASLTYCMYQDGTPSTWGAGKGDCFDHETVTERMQKRYEAQDPKLPPDERSRLARAQACEGVRVPEESNAISSLCRKR